MPEDPTSQAFFERKYREADDPWNFATSAYEQRRYGVILQVLGPRFFRRAFEPGCSIGVLTERLSRKCGRVDAVDVSPTAASRTRERCSDLENVTVTQGSLRSFPEGVEEGEFDLIVFSEIGYYFDAAALGLLAQKLTGRLERGGVFFAAHWLGVSSDHLLSGDQVHEVLHATSGLKRDGGQRHEDFRIDKWTRT